MHLCNCSTVFLPNNTNKNIAWVLQDIRTCQPGHAKPTFLGPELTVWHVCLVSFVFLFHLTMCWQDAKVKQLENSLKQAADEKSSLARQLQVAKTQIERQNQVQEQAKHANASLEKQLTSVRKVFFAQ